MSFSNFILIFSATILGVIAYIKDIYKWQWNKKIVIFFLVIFLSIQIGQYLQSNAQLLQAENLKEYSHWAHYNALGFAGEVENLNIPTPVSDIIYGMMVEKEKDLHILPFTQDNKKKLKEAIKEYPKYPFSYYYLGVILKNENNNTWKEYIKKAKEIFEITVTVDGCREDHQKYLEKSNQLLDENKKGARQF